MDEELQNVISFITYIEKLKRMQRYKGQYYWRDYPEEDRYESVADHSWRVAVLVITISRLIDDEFNELKAIKMSLIHDIPEIIAGDKSPMGKDGTGKNTHAYSSKVEKTKQKQEKDAAKKIFTKLPNELGEEFYNLWQEHEEGKSLEAKVVKSLDKIEAMIQVYEYRKGYLFKDHLKFTTEYGQKGANAHPVLERLGQKIANLLKSEFKEYKT